MAINRRDALKGVSLGAGSLLFAPVLSRLTAQAAGVKQQTKRFVFVVESNGFTPQQAAPVDYTRKSRHQRPLGGSSEMADFSLSNHKLPPALEPLTPWKNKLTIVQGLSGRVCGGGHSNNFKALDACGRGAGGESRSVLGETIDGALAKTIPGIFPFIGLGISKRLENSALYNVSAWAADKALPHIVKPDQAYSTLFGSVAGDADKNELWQKIASDEMPAGDDREKLSPEQKPTIKAWIDAGMATVSARQKNVDPLLPADKQHAPQEVAGAIDKHIGGFLAAANLKPAPLAGDAKQRANEKPADVKLAKEAEEKQREANQAKRQATEENALCDNVKSDSDKLQRKADAARQFSDRAARAKGNLETAQAGLEAAIKTEAYDRRHLATFD